jgi:cell division protein ZapA
MGSSETVRVIIHGDDYSIRGDVDNEMTQKVASYVDRKMSETQTRLSLRDKLKIAILSAMNITGELFDSESKKEHTQKQMYECQKLAEKLGKKIDLVLGAQT